MKGDDVDLIFYKIEAYLQDWIGGGPAGPKTIFLIK
jgi:hypothetical protein